MEKEHNQGSIACLRGCFNSVEMRGEICPICSSSAHGNLRDESEYGSLGARAEGKFEMESDIRTYGQENYSDWIARALLPGGYKRRAGSSSVSSATRVRLPITFDIARFLHFPFLRWVLARCTKVIRNLIRIGLDLANHENMNDLIKILKDLLEAFFLLVRPISRQSNLENETLSFFLIGLYLSGWRFDFRDIYG